MSALRSLYTIELRRLLSYRVAFWLQLIISVIVTITVAYYLWDAIFNYTSQDRFGGFTFDQMVFYYLLIPLIGGLTTPEDNHQISSEIYEGELTKYILYPLNFFSVAYMRQMANVTIGILRFFVGIGVYLVFFDSPVGFQMTPFTILTFFLFAILATTVYFTMTICIEMIAFWIDTVWSLRVMLRFVVRFAGGSLLPLSLFPETLQTALKFLPFHLFYWFPVRILTGHASAIESIYAIGLAFVWIALFSFIAIAIWNRGKYRYSGVGI